jgi:hypothetical protein
MDRLTKHRAALTLLLLFVRPPVAASGPSSPEQLPVINGSVNAWEFERLKYNQHLQQCRSVDCTALKSLVRSFDYLFKLYLPNTMATIGPPQLPRGPIPIVRDVARHPQLRGPSCKLLRVLAKDYFDWSVGLLTVELASLISKGDRQCVRRVVMALPKNNETRELIENAREDCVGRQEPNCSAISFQ